MTAATTDPYRSAPPSPLTRGLPQPETPEAGIAWGMQIALHYDKVRPARRIDAAEAAARAVVRLLADQRAAPGGQWHEAVSYWRDGRIRKLVRRARGKRWDEVQDLPGVTVTQEGPPGWAPARARAFVPAPVRPLPPALAKTQVEGTHFPHGDRLPPPPAQVTARILHDPAGAGEIVLTGASTSRTALVTIEVTPLEEMTSGKLCAQVAHAAQRAWESPLMPDLLRLQWADDGFGVRVVFPDQQAWTTTPRPVSITDAGLTELDGPAETVRAYWPDQG